MSVKIKRLLLLLIAEMRATPPSRWQTIRKVIFFPPKREICSKEKKSELIEENWKTLSHTPTTLSVQLNMLFSLLKRHLMTWFPLVHIKSLFASNSSFFVAKLKVREAFNSIETSKRKEKLFFSCSPDTDDNWYVVNDKE